MADTDNSRSETLAKLAQSRAEIRRVLEPPPHREHHPGPREAHLDEQRGGSFPRSRTMKMLMTGRGLGTVGAVVGGLLVARPAMALKLLRLVPTGAVAQALLVKAITSFRNRNSA